MTSTECWSAWWKRAAAVGLATASVAVAGQIPADGRFRVQPDGARGAYLPPLAASSHAANLLLLRSGDLLCFWFAGPGEGNGGVGIAFARLRAGAKQWEAPRMIDRDPHFSYQNPVGFEAPDGTLWLFHTEQAAGQGQAHAKVLVLTSRDGGAHWSAPRELFDAPGSFTRQPMVMRRDGAWLLPMYVTPSAGIVDDAQSNYSVIELSRDAGRRWEPCPVPHSDGLVQPSVVPPGSGGEYIAFFRSRFADFIYRSVSADGCHWGAPEKTTLPNNNASIQAARLADGKIAIVFNDTHAAKETGKPATGPRVPLSVALSADDGKTWGPQRDLETRASGAQEVLRGLTSAPETAEEYSYPALVQLRNGDLAVGYTFRRETIKVVEFPEAWVGEEHAPGAQ